jgi:hypothetical protein
MNTRRDVHGKAKVAVATVSGRAYFLLVNGFRERGIEFLSLMPGEPVPPEVKLVITTEKERARISHDRILVYHGEMDVNTVISEAVKILQGKESYGKIVIGIDPGEAFGFAVVADGKVGETKNCFSPAEVLNEIVAVLKDSKIPATAVSVKIGNGVPVYNDLLAMLDSELPDGVVLEVVSEVGTDRQLNHDEHSRRRRHIAAAIRIAGRAGYVYPRRELNETVS